MNNNVMNDNIKNPAHYTYGKIQPKDYIRALDLNFNLGNVVKYVSRAGHKRSATLSAREKAIEDLEKARQYIDFELEYLRGVYNGNT